jgi:hypothetical protein
LSKYLQNWKCFSIITYNMLENLTIVDISRAVLHKLS